MKKYNNIANQMGFTVVFVNVVFPVMIVAIILTESGINMVAGASAFLMVVITFNFVYFFLLDQWYFTYYDEEYILQKWLYKIKKIKLNEVKYIYFIDNLVVLSENAFNISTKQIKTKEKMQIKKTLKSEVCIVINVYDKLFPQILLKKCSKAVKIDLKVKEKVYREMFELD